jgi:thiol-disulfide isomerase/thioredoxin
MLDKITGVFSGLMKDKKTLILVIIGVVLLIAASYYVYTTHISPKLNPEFVANNEIVEQGESSEAELYFFFTEWCPHCKKAKPEWEKLVSEFEGKPINGTIVHFKAIDCDKDEATADEFKVEGYPTVKLVKDGEIIEYDAKPEYETLVEFLHTSL